LWVDPAWSIIADVPTAMVDDYPLTIGRWEARVSTPYEEIARKARESLVISSQPTAEEAKLVSLRVPILSLLGHYHSVGKVSEPKTFSVPGAIGCAAKIDDESSVIAYFVGPVTTDNTAAIYVWNSADHFNPKGDPIAWGRSYGIETTEDKTLGNQAALLDFIAKWVESGKPGKWKPRNR
jgi:hypothetical protein